MSLSDKTADQLKDLADRLITSGNSRHSALYSEVVKELDSRTFGSNPLPSSLAVAQFNHDRRQDEAERQASEQAELANSLRLEGSDE